MIALFLHRFTELYEELRDQNHKIGRTKLAEICGVTKGQVDSWLAGRTEPDIQTLMQIARNTGISVSWLTGETDLRQYDVSDNLKSFLQKLPPAALTEIDLYFDYLSFKYRIPRNNNQKEGKE